MSEWVSHYEGGPVIILPCEGPLLIFNTECNQWKETVMNFLKSTQTFT